MKKHEVESNVKGKLIIQAVFIAFFMICGAFILAVYLKSTGIYPKGPDIYGHIFKADFLYESIKKGDFYPLYTPYWYNGVQLFRHWAPLSYYLLAMLEFITGNPMDSYLLLIVVSYAIGGIGWLLFGVRYNRLPLCAAIGFLWFMLPSNATVFFGEGNLPRMVGAMLLPYFVYFLWVFIEEKKYINIIPIIIITIFVSLCHLMLGAMLGISTFIFTLIYSIANKRIRESAYVIIGMLISFAMIGIYIYPSLKGGITSMDNSSMLEFVSERAVVSLDPFVRLIAGVEYFYFGLSFLLISVFGIVLANKKRIAGFLTLIVIFIGTTTTVAQIIVNLPLGEFLWMKRFTPIAYALFFISIIEWKKLKKVFVLLVCLILLIDTLPSLNYINFFIPAQTLTVLDRQKNTADSWGLSYAKEITNQRIASMDLSAFGSFVSYEISTKEPRKQYTFGWAWQGAATANNIVLLNTALEKGHFNYIFDRCIELGSDTVIVRRDQLPKIRDVDNRLLSSALLLGYNLMTQNEHAYVFKKDTPKIFGVITEYEGVAIGNAASQISLLFPYFEKGNSISLTDYSFEELVKYKKIYLSEFTYFDKKQAENLIDKLTKSGVQVFIDMNRVPYDSRTQRMNFMGVTSQDISFNTQLPTLLYNNNKFNTDIFTAEYNTWNTVFLENVKNVIGYADFEDTKLTFCGTGENKNLYFIGFNIMYHAMETKDQGALTIVKDIFALKEDILPKRTLIPVDISYETNGITIDSPVNNLNTTIAYQDIFRSGQTIISNNNLLVVNKGRTEIFFVYPYFTVGLIISIVGFIAFVALIYFIFKSENKNVNDKWLRIISKRNTIK